jgi:long-subunit fatty acid transport protein
MIALLLLSGAADAAAYYFLDAGTRGMSRAGAFVASVDDLSAQYYNPAGLIRLQRPQAYINFSGIGQDISFTRKDYDPASGELLTTYETVDNQGGLMAIPAFGFSTRLGLPNTVFAIGLYPPFAPRFQYDPEGPQRYTLMESLLIQTNFGPSVAHRFSDWLTVGLGAQWVYVSAQQSLVLDTCDPDAPDALLDDCRAQPEKYDIDVSLEMADPVQFAFSGGLLVEPAEWVAIGASFMSPVEVDGTGSIVAEFGEEHALVTSGGLAQSSYTDDDVRVLLQLPWIFRLGTAFYPTDNLNIELAGVYTTWSTTSEITVTDVNLDLTLGETGQTFAVDADGNPQEAITVDDDIVLPAGFNNAWSVRLGGQYDYNDVTVRAGVAYETSAVPASTQSVSAADGDKFVYGIGGTYRLKRRMSFDLGVSQTFLQDQEITSSEVSKIVIPVFPLTNLADPDNLAIQNGDVVGTGAFSSTALFVSGGVTYRFGRFNNEAG